MSRSAKSCDLQMIRQPLALAVSTVQALEPPTAPAEVAVAAMATCAVGLLHGPVPVPVPVQVQVQVQVWVPVPQQQVSGESHSVCKRAFLRLSVFRKPDKPVRDRPRREHPLRQQLAPRWPDKKPHTYDKTCSVRHWPCRRHHTSRPQRCVARWTQDLPSRAARHNFYNN